MFVKRAIFIYLTAMRKTHTTTALIPAERIERRIYLLRGQKVMISSDLAILYDVATKKLNQAVKRNPERFPPDFMFQLTPDEAKNLKSQSVTSSWGGARRTTPYAFTEQGVVMLSAVLRSPTAVAVSIEIMRVFSRLRHILASNKNIRLKLEELERKLTDHDHQLGAIFDAIRELMDDDESEARKPRIGFATEAQATAGTQSRARRRIIKKT